MWNALLALRRRGLPRSRVTCLPSQIDGAAVRLNGGVWAPLVRVAHREADELAEDEAEDVLVHFAQGGEGTAVARSKALHAHRDMALELLAALCRPRVCLVLRVSVFARHARLDDHFGAQLVGLLERARLLRAPLSAWPGVERRARQLRRFHPQLEPRMVAPFYYFLARATAAEMSACAERVEAALAELERDGLHRLVERLPPNKRAPFHRLLAALGLPADLRRQLSIELDSLPPGALGLRAALRAYERCFALYRRPLCAFQERRGF